MLVPMLVCIILVLITFCVFRRSISQAKSQPKESNIAPEIKKPMKPRGKIPIFFGTQTGRSESFARNLSKALRSEGWSPMLVDLADFSDTTFASLNFCIIIISTQGQGEPPPSAKNFYKWLQKMSKAKSEVLVSLQYCLFCVGSSAYGDLYNYTGIQVDRMLEILKAKRFFSTGMGDEENDIAGTFENWKKDILGALPENIEDIKLSFNTTNNTNYTLLNVLTIKQLTYKTFHIEIECESYTTAATLGIVPENSDHNVKILCGLYRDVYESFKQKYDITGLMDFSDINIETNMSLMDFLTKHSDKNLSMDQLLPMLNRIKPRLYTIASSSLMHPNTIHLVFDIVKEDNFIGLCSSYILQMYESTVFTPIQTFFQDSPFKFKTSKVVMIGTGSGIAPFRALVQEAYYMKYKLGQEAPSITLFYGCRDENNFLYNEEILHYTRQSSEIEEFQVNGNGEGPIEKLFVAFSRTAHVHVQDVLSLEFIKASLSNRAQFMICGNGNMARSVLDLLRSADSEAFQALEQNGLVSVEIW